MSGLSGETRDAAWAADPLFTEDDEDNDEDEDEDEDEDDDEDEDEDEDDDDEGDVVLLNALERPPGRIDAPIPVTEAMPAEYLAPSEGEEKRLPTSSSGPSPCSNTDKEERAFCDCSTGGRSFGGSDRMKDRAARKCVSVLAYEAQRCGRRDTRGAKYSAR